MYRKSYEVVGYAFEADFHCLGCTATRFGLAAYRLYFEATDNEGNLLYPIFLDSLTGDEICGDCFTPLLEA